jgi:hypothetical protein
MRLPIMLGRYVIVNISYVFPLDRRIPEMDGWVWEELLGCPARMAPVTMYNN